MKLHFYGKILIVILTKKSIVKIRFKLEVVDNEDVDSADDKRQKIFSRVSR